MLHSKYPTIYRVPSVHAQHLAIPDISLSNVPSDQVADLSLRFLSEHLRDPCFASTAPDVVCYVLPLTSPLVLASALSSFSSVTMSTRSKSCNSHGDLEHPAATWTFPVIIDSCDHPTPALPSSSSFLRFPALPLFDEGVCLSAFLAACQPC